MEGNQHYDELHELIHSLDHKERRHFSVFAKGNAAGESHNYELLFQILVKMPEYDAELLSKEMERLEIGTPLAAAKNHLKTMLFRALREYKSYHTTYTDLLEGLQNLAILYKKKLFSLLRKEIKRLKKLATAYSEYHILLEIGDYERRLHKATAQQEIVEGLEEIHAEMLQAEECAHNQMELGYLKDKMMLISKKGSTGWESAVETVISHPLMADSSKAKTIFAKVYYHQVKAWEHHVKNDFRRAKTHWHSVLNILEKEDHLKEEHPNLYQRNLFNYLRTLCGDADLEKIQAMLDVIRNHSSAQISEQADAFILRTGLEFSYKLNTRDWKGIELMVPSLEEELQAYASLIDKGQLLVFQFHIALYYFLHEDYSSSRKWLREITEVSRTERSMDYQRLARVLQLLTWHDEDYDSLLESQYRSVKRYFDKYGSHPLDLLTLELFEMLIQSKDASSRQAAFAHFHRQLSATTTNGAQGLILRAWAFAKSKSQSPKEVIRRLNRT